MQQPCYQGSSHTRQGGVAVTKANTGATQNPS